MRDLWDPSDADLTIINQRVGSRQSALKGTRLVSASVNRKAAIESGQLLQDAKLDRLLNELSI